MTREIFREDKKSRSQEVVIHWDDVEKCFKKEKGYRDKILKIY